MAVLSEEQFHVELEKGYADMKAGHTKDARQAFADIRKITDYDVYSKIIRTGRQRFKVDIRIYCV